MSTKRLLLFLMVLVAAPSLLLAQDSLSEAYVSPNERLTLRYPEGWVVEAEEDGITVLATSGGVIEGVEDTLPPGEAALALVFSDNDTTPELQILFEDPTPVGIVRRATALVAENNEGVSAFTEPERFTLDGRPAARSSGRLEGNDVLLIAFDVENGIFGLGVIVTAAGELARVEPKMLSIIESVNYVPAPPPVAINLDQLQVITPDNAAQLDQLWSVTPHQGRVYAVAISPDGRIVASSGADNRIVLLDAATGEDIRTLSGHTAAVQQVLFIPNSELLVSLSDDGTLRIWDVESGDERLSFSHDEPLFYMAVSPRWVAYSSYTQDTETFETETSTVWLADMQEERERSIITLEDDQFVNSLAFSPDGDVLMFSASNDQDPDERQTHVWLWDIERDEEMDTWAREGNPVDVFFTPTGRPYATMNDIVTANDLLVWDVEENYIQHRLTGYQDLTYHVVLNAEGKIMGAASYDGTVRLWELETGDQLAALEHEGAAYGVAFSDDGRLVATSDDLGNVVLWGIE